jgi:short-subunit dehydrogenase
MVDHGGVGHIVNVASAAAFIPSRTLPAYAASKAAVLMLTECLRAELADDGIGVSAICPGFVDTGIATATRYVGATDDEQAAKRQAADRLYKRRRVTPDAVADAIVRAVDHDLPLVPVAAEARLGLFTQRFAPRVRRLVARVDLSPPVARP